MRTRNSVTLEGSASTFWQRGASQHARGMHTALIPEILSYLLGHRIKLVVLLCDPSQRLLSDFMVFATRRYRIKLKRAGDFGSNHNNASASVVDAFVPSAADFHRHVLEALAYYNTCRRSHSTLECLYAEPYKRPRPWLAVGAYAHYLRVWLRYFPQKQVNILARVLNLTHCWLTQRMHHICFY